MPIAFIAESCYWIPIGFLLDHYWIPIEFLLNSDWIPNGPTPAPIHGRWWGGREVPVPFFETTVFSWCSETTTLLDSFSGPWAFPSCLKPKRSWTPLLGPLELIFLVFSYANRHKMG